MAAEWKASEILDRIEEHAPKDNPRLQNYLAALREALAEQAAERQKDQELLGQYQEAYDKLTQPANRMAVFLRWVEEPDKPRLALIALGDQEFLTTFDPAIPEESLQAGTRVRVNDAYAIVGVLPDPATGALVKVGQVFEDGRLRVGSDVPGSGGRVIERGPALAGETVREGDEVRLDPTGRVAVERYEKKESQDYFLEEVPEIPWEKVGGQDAAIKLIRETIEQPLLHPEIFRRFDKKPIKGILLYGPPGCGKTLLGKATAYNLTREYEKQVGHPVKEYFMAISGPKILNMWLGETERIVREIFATARQRAKEGRLVFIFMDEAESVLRTRSSGRYLNISNTVVPQFCAELDGLQSLDNVVLMLTSNRPDYIDPAVLRPERIDRKIKIQRPDRTAAEAILGIYLHGNLPFDPEILAQYDDDPDCARQRLVTDTLDYLWRTGKESEFLKVFFRNGSSETLYRKDLLSGALLKSIVDRAKDLAIRRAIQEPSFPHGIRAEDLAEAVDQEYRENEIFPKSDTQEDWLQLLDVPPENVAAVKPIGPNRGEEFARKAIL
jgi:proteasome-associated ATPase